MPYPSNEPVPTRIRNSVYPSMGAAARANGVSIRAVQHAMENGTLDNVGNGKSRPRSFEYDGKKYRSQAECARAHGLHTSTFNGRLDRRRDPVTGA